VRRLIDTVFVEGRVEHVRRQTASSQVEPRGNEWLAGEHASGGLGLLSYSQLDSPANLPKGNSLEEDTLLRSFRFVTL
jgi:hypothetical protein